VLDLSGTGSRAIPNGLRELRGARPYQAFYDERYFTRDAPQPPQQQSQQQQKLRAPILGKSASARSITRPAPELSFTGSTVSVDSSHGPSSTNGKDKTGKEKEKKRRFLGF